MPRKIKWAKFEEAIQNLFERLIPELFEGSGFSLEHPPARQRSGTQYGRDITIEWTYYRSHYRWWIECKANTQTENQKDIPKAAYSDKVLEAISKSGQPTVWCLMGAYLDPCPWFKAVTSDLNNSQKIKTAHILHWPLEGPNGLKACLLCYEDLFVKVYGNGLYKKKLPMSLAAQTSLKKQTFENIKTFIMNANNRGLSRLGERKIKKPQK